MECLTVLWLFAPYVHSRGAHAARRHHEPSRWIDSAGAPNRHEQGAVGQSLRDSIHLVGDLPKPADVWTDAPTACTTR